MTFFFKPQTSYWSVHFLEKLPKVKSDQCKGSPFHFLALWDFFRILFCLQRVPRSNLLKSPLVISELKRYVRTFDVISEQYCVLLRRMWRFENKSFPMKTSDACFENCVFWALDIEPTLDVTVLLILSSVHVPHFNDSDFFKVSSHMLFFSSLKCFKVM